MSPSKTRRAKSAADRFAAAATSRGCSPRRPTSNGMTSQLQANANECKWDMTQIAPPSSTFLGLSRGRTVHSKSNSHAIVFCLSSSPNGQPRLALRRNAFKFLCGSFRRSIARPSALQRQLLGRFDASSPLPEGEGTPKCRPIITDRRTFLL